MINLFKRINLFKWPKRYTYECGCNLQDVAIQEFNNIKPDLEKLYGRKIKVINMKRKWFEDYKVIFELEDEKDG